MRLRHAKTLITGKPGVGKTTLVQIFGKDDILTFWLAISEIISVKMRIASSCPDCLQL